VEYVKRAMSARIYNVGRNGVGVLELLFLLHERLPNTLVVGDLSEDYVIIFWCLH